MLNNMYSQIFPAGNIFVVFDFVTYCVLLHIIHYLILYRAMITKYNYITMNYKNNN